MARRSAMELRGIQRAINCCKTRDSFSIVVNFDQS
jgi:hypothetical protein